MRGHRRKLLVSALLAGTVAALTLLAREMTSGDLDRADKVASVTGLLVALLGLALTLREPLTAWLAPSHAATLARLSTDEAATAADELARSVRIGWEQEAARRGLFDPVPITLHWRSTARPVSAPVTAITAGEVGGHPTGLRLSGDLNRIVETLDGLPRHRLVILGDAGTGKTALAIVALLRVLRERSPGEPVPVLVPMASWDPGESSVREWIGAQLADGYYRGQPEVPEDLLAEGLIMPILDGLDEMPESVRPAAIRNLTRFLDGQPLVLTSRGPEFEQAVTAARAVVAEAAVVELERISTGDALDYLARAGDVEGDSWSKITAELARDPAGRVAVALDTPLMLNLARAVHAAKPARVDEILDATRFPDASAIREWLTDQLIPAAYGPTDAGRARRWLTFLAREMTRRGTTVLTWWQLPQALPAAVLAAGYGIVATFCAYFSLVDTYGWGGAVRVSLLLGLIAAVAITFAPAPAPARVDGYLRARLPGALIAMLRGLGIGTACGFVAGLVLGVAYSGPLFATYPTMVHSWLENTHWLLASAAIGLYFGTTTGGLTGIIVGLIIGVSRGAAAGLRGGGKVALVMAGVIALAIGKAASESAAERHTLIFRVFTQFDYRPAPTFIRDLALQIAGDHGEFPPWEVLLMYIPQLTAFLGLFGAVFGVVLALRRVTGSPLDVTLVTSPQVAWKADRKAALTRFLVVITALGLMYAGLQVVATGHAFWNATAYPTVFMIAVFTASVSAYGRFVIATVILWMAGRMPLSGIAFLESARRRGVLRLSGASYQFRHEVLQAQLSRR
ncbi:NACHT domain-containing NTPase [Actinoplanes sp. L3-i22]|uniref:NACHT domain-containing protein n=1 Tax=Actinoplanes sp. L3-i22 TaxID=2836373 RepID=UPI001C847001|nr:hypothetical protein [Actinoplanes sp. L3-i22]